MAKKLPGSCTGSRRKAIGFSPKDGDVVTRRVSRCSMLPLLGIAVSAGSLATLFTQRAAPAPVRRAAAEEAHKAGMAAAAGAAPNAIAT